MSVYDLQELFEQQFSKKFRCEIDPKRISSSFMLNYINQHEELYELLNGTKKIVELTPRITKTDLLSLISIDKKRGMEFQSFAKDFVFRIRQMLKDDYLDLSSSALRFKKPYTAIGLSGLNIRKEQKFSAFFTKYVEMFFPQDSKEDIGLYREYLLRNTSNVVERLYATIKPLYLRIGFEPVDYLEMGQWGYSHSCTDIERDILHGRNRNHFAAAIFTYMQASTVVVSLFETKEDAEQRNRTAIARQILYKKDDLMMGLRAYGNSSFLKSKLKMALSQALCSLSQTDYKQLTLEGFYKKRIIDNIARFRSRIITNNYRAGGFGYIDTFMYSSYAGHFILIPDVDNNDIGTNQSEQLSFFQETTKQYKVTKQTLMDEFDISQIEFLFVSLANDTILDNSLCYPITLEGSEVWLSDVGAVDYNIIFSAVKNINKQKM